jgi:hypothetical protein
MKLVKEAYYAWGAEVVFITSNFQGNKEIMEGCKAEGIPAFVCLVSYYFRMVVAAHKWSYVHRVRFGTSELTDYG